MIMCIFYESYFQLMCIKQTRMCMVRFRVALLVLNWMDTTHAHAHATTRMHPHAHANTSYGDHSIDIAQATRYWHCRMSIATCFQSLVFNVRNNLNTNHARGSNCMYRDRHIYIYICPSVSDLFSDCIVSHRQHGGPRSGLAEFIWIMWKLVE